MTDDTKDAKQTVTLPRSLLLVGSLVFGGGITGGGVSLYTNPNAKVQELVEQNSELKSEIKSLTDAVNTVAVSVVEVKAELRNSSQAHERFQKLLDDHEDRIRDLEKN